MSLGLFLCCVNRSKILRLRSSVASLSMRLRRIEYLSRSKFMWA